MAKPPRRVAFNQRLSEDVYDALRRAALRETRTVSLQLEAILRQWLEAAGDLAPQPPQADSEVQSADGQMRVTGGAA